MALSSISKAVGHSPCVLLLFGLVIGGSDSGSWTLSARGAAQQEGAAASANDRPTEAGTSTKVRESARKTAHYSELLTRVLQADQGELKEILRHEQVLVIEHVIERARDAGDKSLVPLLLKVAETFAARDWDRGVRGVQWSATAAYDALHAADALANINPQLIAYAKDYKARPLLAEAAILILVRDGNPSTLERLREILDIDRLVQEGEYGSPIVSAYFRGVGISTLDREFNEANKTEDKLHVVFRVFGTERRSSFPGDMSHARASRLPQVYWGRRRLRVLSESHPKEVAEAVMNIDKYRDRASEASLAYRCDVAKFHLGDAARHEFERLLKSHQEKMAAEKAAEEEGARREREVAETARREREAAPVAEPPTPKFIGDPFTGELIEFKPQPPDPEPLFRVRGNGFDFGTLMRLIGRFCEEHGNPYIAFEPLDSNSVPARLATGKFDVGFSLDCLAYRIERDMTEEFSRYRLGTYATAVVVNRKNPLRETTKEWLARTFTGEAKTWRENGGPEDLGRIELYSTAIAAEAGAVFRERVLGNPFYGREFDAELASFKTEPYRQQLTEDQVLGKIAKQVNAIGFIPWHSSIARHMDPRVRVLAVAADDKANAVLPSPETIADGSYYLTSTVTFFVHPDAPPLAHEFCRFVVGPVGATAARSYRLWPEYELEKVRGEQRVAEVKAGKGEPVAVCDLAGVGEAIKAAALELARAKMAVQVTLDAADGSVEQARERLKTGEAELLVVEGELGEVWRGRGVEEGGEEMVLGSRAVGVVVHPGNEFNELTMDDLRQILAGKVDRWPGATGTAERIVLYALPPANPLMALVDRAMGPDLKRAKVTVRPDSQRVILSVAAQPGALGLVDLTKVARRETKVKLLAILPPGEMEAATPAPDRLPDDYPLAQPVHLYLSPKALDAAKSFFTFLKEGGGRDALLAGGLVPRPLPDATEAEIAAAYGPVDESVDEPQAAGPPAQVAAANEDDSPATAAPDPLHDVLRGALGGPAEASPSGVAPTAAQAGADQTAENAAAESTPLDPNPATPRQAEKTAATQPVPGKGRVPHPAASDPLPGEADFAAWITARAVPIGLIGLGVTAVAIALGSLGMKRVRHRNEVMRRYRP